MNQNQRDIPADAQIDDDELEMIRKFRALDERGKRRVLRYLRGEYDDIIAAVGEKIATRDFAWLKNAVSAADNTRIEFDGGDNR